MLPRLLLTLPSYHDLKHENSYHVFMLEMCAWFNSDYTILSNRESGKGRADIIFIKQKAFLPSIVIMLTFCIYLVYDLSFIIIRNRLPY